MPIRKKYEYNRERLLLVALVAVAFFGFLLFSIQQSIADQEALLNDTVYIVPTAAGNKAIRVSSPKIGAAIKSPVTVSGEASVFEAALQVRIKDASGFTLANVQVMTAEGQKMSPFKASIKYKKPTRPNGTVEVFSISPKDGSKINKLKIPVVFKD